MKLVLLPLLAAMTLGMEAKAQYQPNSWNDPLYSYCIQQLGRERCICMRHLIAAGYDEQTIVRYCARYGPAPSAPAGGYLQPPIITF